MKLNFENVMPTEKVDIVHQIERIFAWNQNQRKELLPYSRTRIDEEVGEIPMHTYFIKGKKQEDFLPHISQLRLDSEREVFSIEGNFTKFKKKKVSLEKLRVQLEIAAAKYIKDKNSLLISISNMINEFGTLQSHQRFLNSNMLREFDDEFTFWEFLITKFIPQNASFIKTKGANKVKLEELNRCFANVTPRFKDTNQNAFEFESSDMLGAIMLYLKTKNLKKPPIFNCDNCGKEVSQSQKGGRPVRFCRNNNKCKMQFYRKDNS